MIARTRGLPSERHSNVRAISAQGGSEADLGRKVKTALDETRLLILGAQVLFGFQLNAVFQDAFASLAQSTRLLACAGQLLMVIAIALLIAPSMQHQIVERGSDTVRIHGVTSLFAGVALLPFGLSLGIGLYIVLHHLYGPPAALAGGTTFFVLAAFCWYGLGVIVNPHNRMQRMQREQSRPCASICRPPSRWPRHQPQAGAKRVPVKLMHNPSTRSVRTPSPRSWSGERVG